MSQEKHIPRLLERYKTEILPKLKQEFGYTNDLAVPRVRKITVNMGLGEAISDAKIVEKAASDLAQITGQKPKICRAKKPISNFKLRKGLAIGCCVTLRRYRMYEFLDRLISIAMPRIRDFRGFSPRGFDGNGNYTFGLTEQTIFPEIDVDKVQRPQGMNITICTNTNKKEYAYELLKFFGMPFREERWPEKH